MGREPLSFEMRFWSKVDKRGPDECWLWMTTQNERGYGQFRHRGPGTQKAHRIAYELTYGPIPHGLQLDHLCRVRHCVNPRHLEPVTWEENMRRGVEARSTCRKGHPYDEANTYRETGNPGHRVCRACRREIGNRWYAQHRAIVQARKAARAALQRTEGGDPIRATP